jgi:hypothetical protein
MKRRRTTIHHQLWRLLTSALALKVFFAVSFAAAQATPHALLFDSDNLIETKKRIQANDSALIAPLTRLKHDANRTLTVAPFSVTHKDIFPPSGNKHDYMSIAPYWWPNPNTPNGLPYVRRDGEVNPERDQTSDRKRLEYLVQSVKTLALTYFFTGREEYAGCAARFLRVWFLDDATQMSPHLRFAQSVPGRNHGRGAGIIETHNLPELIDAVGLLSDANSWTKTDQQRLLGWFGSYLTWLVESPEGKTEAKAENNHGSWYDVQVAAFSVFVGRNELAKKVLTEFSSMRIARQIERDGRQPRELARTRAWNYSIFNLEALINAASIADQLRIDLWNYQTNDRRSIRKALDWLLPFSTGEKKWSDKHISTFQPEILAPLLRRAALRYREPAYEKAIIRLPKLTGDERWQLLYPILRESK